MASQAAQRHGTDGRHRYRRQLVWQQGLARHGALKSVQGRVELGCDAGAHPRTSPGSWGTMFQDVHTIRR